MKMMKHVIDLNKQPLLVNSLEWVIDHKEGGLFEWDPKKVELALLEKQELRDGIDSYKIIEGLADKNPFNANLLDYLLEHPDLIPKQWEVELTEGWTREIFFWGTIYGRKGYRGFATYRIVRSLEWDGSSWKGSQREVWRQFYKHDPAIVMR